MENMEHEITIHQSSSDTAFKIDPAVIEATCTEPPPVRNNIKRTSYVAEKADGISIAAAAYQSSGISTFSTAQMDDSKNYPVAPFSLNKNETEHVVLNSGSLNLNITDFVIPGKNGFDLAVTRRYDSSQSNESDITPKFDKMALYGYLVTAKSKVRLATTRNTLEIVLRLESNQFDYFDSLSARAAAEKAWDYWCYDEIYVGNKGFHVNINGVATECEILSIYSENITTPYGTTEIVKSNSRPNSHFNDTYGLGLGWSLGFPSVEVVKETYKIESLKVKYYKYLHLGDGRTYSIDDNNLVKDYVLKDFTFSKQGGTIGGRTYHYTLTFKDGKKAYFFEPNKDSIKLTAMSDRFGNNIYFNFSVGGSTITDTLGQTISLVKSGSNMTWTLPDGATVSYTLNGTGLLGSVKDQCGQVTNYGYEYYHGETNPAFTKGTLFKSYMDSYRKDAGVTISLRPLTYIRYPTGAYTNYLYEFVETKCGDWQGTQSAMLLRTSSDFDNRGSTVGYHLYNYETGYDYSQSNNYCQMFIKKASDIDYDYSRETQYYFDYQMPLNTQIVKYNKVVYKTRKISSFYAKLLPTKETVVISQNGKSITNVFEWKYDEKGNVISEILPLQKESKYTYGSSCNLPLTKRYWRDSVNEILEQNTLTSDGTKLARKELFEISGGVSRRKEAVSCGYDSVHNLVSERHHAVLTGSVPQNSTNDRIISYSYANTNPSLPAMFNNIFMTAKSVPNVKNINGSMVPPTPGYSIGTLAEKFVYDKMGRVIETVDQASRKTKFSYDSLGREIKKVFPKNYETEPEKSVQTKYTTNASVNTVQITDESGHITTYGYTVTGRLWFVRPDNPGTSVVGRPYTKELFYDHRDQLYREYEYCRDGKIETYYSYDLLDRPSKKMIRGKTGADFYEVYNYNDTFDPSGRLSLEGKYIETDSTSIPSIYSYTLTDALGRVVKEVVGDNSGVKTSGITSISYSYDYAGNKKTQTDSLNNILAYSYDYAGRVISETRQVENENGTIYNATAYTNYDGLGNKIYSTDFISSNNKTSYTYDILGRLIGQTSPLNANQVSSKQIFYDQVGNVTTEQVRGEAGWKATNFTYDCLNRVLDTSSSESRTRNEYVDRSNGTGYSRNVYTGMQNLSISGAAKTTYSYNRFGDVTFIIYPDNCSEYFYYDGFGQLTSKRDRKGNTIVYEYDHLNRLVSETASNPNIYKKSSFNTNGSKRHWENENLRIDYTYDTLGRLLTENEQCKDGSNKVAKSYAYDSAGNRTSFSLKKDNKMEIQTSYEYGKQNLLKRVKRNGITIANYVYDQNNSIKKKIFPGSAITTEYIYNQGGLITDLYNRKSLVHRSSYHYTYHLDGNQAKKTTKISRSPDKVISYKYDRLGRLVAELVSGGTNTSYQYDYFGNRSRMSSRDKNAVITITTYTYDLLNRLLTETTANKDAEENKEKKEIYTYSYDNNGNQVRRQWEKYVENELERQKAVPKTGIYNDKFKQDVVILDLREYNKFNQLTSVYQDTLITKYAYRPDGLRHKKLFANGTETSHLWDGQNMVAEYGANGKVFARYLRGIGLIARDQDNILQYYLHNGHGDVVERTDQNGTTLKNYDYDAFGVEESQEELDNNPFRYCGEYFDRESGTIYLRARNYSPTNGRFTSEDPARSGLNWYGYCENNPIKFIDPSGKFAATAVIGLGIANIWNPLGWIVLVVAVVAVVGLGIYLVSSEHKKKGTTNPANKKKHEKGRTRKARDAGGEKGDERRPYKKGVNPKRDATNKRG